LCKPYRTNGRWLLLFREPARAIGVQAGMGNVIIDNEAIRHRAYLIWQAEGCPEGRDHEHWLQAQRELCDEAGLCVGGIQPLPTKHVQGRAEE
jgi:hypothetical protein